MIKVFIIIGVIFLLLVLALYLIYSDYNIEKFTDLAPATDNLQQNLIDKEAERVAQNAAALRALQQSNNVTPSPTSPTSDPTVLTPTTTSAPTSATSAPTSATSAPTNNIVDFLAVISAYEPWGIYYADNFSENKLKDLLGREYRNAIATGTINISTSSGNGANGQVKSISGSSSTFIEWPANSIPEKFTICSISRYTGTANNKRILTARNATSSNDWVHGHKNGKRGVVYYSEYKTNNSPDFNLTGNNTDWVVTCAKNDIITPTNVYINNAPSGIKGGGKGGLRLAINKIDDNTIINEQSDFALSYVIIWNTNLTNTALKIVSNAFMNYLNTGEDLLFDTNSLSTDDKIKVINTKTNFLKDEMNEISLRYNLPNGDTVLSTNNADVSVNTNVDINNPIAETDEEKKQRLYTLLANYENAIRGNVAASLAPTNNVINLNLQSDNTDTTCTDIGTRMPEPTERSFTDTLDIVNVNAANTDQRPYIWCNKCNDNNNNSFSTAMCKAYDTCKTNYAKNNKVDNKTTFTTINELDKTIYDNCINAFVNFPKYLQANSDISEIR